MQLLQDSEYQKIILPLKKKDGTTAIYVTLLKYKKLTK